MGLQVVLQGRGAAKRHVTQETVIRVGAFVQPAVSLQALKTRKTFSARVAFKAFARVVMFTKMGAEVLAGDEGFGTQRADKGAEGGMLMHVVPV